MATNPNVYHPWWKYQAHTTQGQWSIAHIDAVFYYETITMGLYRHRVSCRILSLVCWRVGEGRGDRLQLCVHWVVLLKNDCSALASLPGYYHKQWKTGQRFWQTADVSSVSSVDHTLVSKHQISNTTTMYLCTCTVCVHTYSCAVYTGQCKIVPRITVMLWALLLDRWKQMGWG